MNATTDFGDFILPESNLYQRITESEEKVIPEVPLDYIDSVICGSGADCVNQALENNPAAKFLFGSIIVGFMVELEAARNGGKISKDLNAMATETLGSDALWAMTALGYRW